MSICFQAFVHDEANNSSACVPGERSNPDGYELSVCNANGIDLLLALGLAPEPVGGPIPIGAFARLVTAALRRRLGKRSPALEATASAEPGRMTMTCLGRCEGYVEERLGDLARLVQRGRAAGATLFSWG